MSIHGDMSTSKQMPVRSRQVLWQRITLLCVLGYEGLRCLLGGILLIIAPDGRLMKMPVHIMHGAFPDFLVPGIILFILGLLNSAAFAAVLKRASKDWLLASLAIGGLLIWFWVEIAILQELHWLHAMWGLPVVIGAIVAVPLLPQYVITTGLLLSGIISSLLYAVINVIVPYQWPEYNSMTQTVSELSAVDAPTRMLWNVLCVPYTVLTILFALGILRTAGTNRKLRTAGTLLTVYGFLGALWPFAPMHLRETLSEGGGTFSDTMHLTLGAVTELIYIASLVLAATALGKLFRYYSFATLILLVIFGALTFREAPNIAVNLPTPRIGLWERVNIGAFLLWVIVLAIVLLRRMQGSVKENASHGNMNDKPDALDE